MRDFGYFLQFLGCVVFMYFMLRPVKHDSDEQD